jgi:hypothetical protein
MSSKGKGAKDVPVGETQGHRTTADRSFWDRMSGIVEENHHSTAHVLSLFPTYVRRQQLTRFLAHYELFKMAVDLPGNFVEIGVYRGSSFFTWHKLMETFCATDRRRRVFGFDHFQGLSDFHAKDGAYDAKDGKVPGGFDTQAVRSELLSLINLHNDDNLIPGAPRSHLIEGDVKQTLPRFLEDQPGLRISLLHLDADLYEPTLAALEYLWPRVVNGGVVVFDEYGLMPWEGESRAADEYFDRIGYKPTWRRFPWSTQPQGYLVKQ